MRVCELCGKEAIREKRVRDYQYRTSMGIVTIEGESIFEECGNCGEVFVPGTLIDEWNRMILQHLAGKHSLYSPHELQFIFSVLPFSQNELAKATGKDRSTLSRYKTGMNPIDPLFDDALQQIMSDFLAGNQETLDRLKGRGQFVAEGEKINRVKVR